MALPASREEFKQYCLRALGKPVIEINVSDEQVDDRIDEALQYYADYHFDGTEKIYLKHQVTTTDKTNGWIPIPEGINGISNILRLNNGIVSSGMFSAKYQFILNNLHDFTNYNLTNYFMSFQHLELLEQTLNGSTPINFNRHMNKLFIHTNWNILAPGDYIVVECYQVVDPSVNTDVWKDRWLQNYTIQKIKLQWASNLSKFTGMQLPGGVQFNAEQMYQEAKETILKMEEEMMSSFSLPVSDMIG